MGVSVNIGGVKAVLPVSGRPVSLTNLVSNGNFANTTGWTPSFCSLGASGNIISLTGDGSDSITRIRQDFGVKPSNHKLFVAGKTLVTNTVCQFSRMFIRDGTGGSVYADARIDTPAQDTLYPISAILTMGSLTNNIVLYYDSSYANSATQNGKVAQGQCFIAVDLTAAFGAGNEPTLAQFNDLLTQFPSGWFNGTTTAKYYW
jgi:hypothetical protein